MIGKLAGEVVEMLDDHAEDLVKSGKAKYATDDRFTFPPDFEDFIKWTHSSTCDHYFDLDDKNWYYIIAFSNGGITPISGKKSKLIGNTETVYMYWLNNVKHKST